ncbi:hypothetical protein BGZ63DRAFT_375836 [Mariannaea sp. PMI_226]|nr:hypothetical protein BGZ63DRAFT_375836 [Mariannaea sp. PMI_226]
MVAFFRVGLRTPRSGLWVNYGEAQSPNNENQDDGGNRICNQGKGGDSCGGAIFYHSTELCAHSGSHADLYQLIIKPFSSLILCSWVVVHGGWWLVVCTPCFVGCLGKVMSSKCREMQVVLQFHSRVYIRGALPEVFGAASAASCCNRHLSP